MRLASFKRVVFDLLARPAFLRAGLGQSGTLILMFHGFRDQSNQGIENNDGKHLSGTSFDALLSKLGKVVDFISLREFIERQEQKSPISKPSAILTFDDGYESNYRVAFPILQRYKIPVTIFLTTEFVADGKQLWTNRLEFSVEHSQQKEVTFNGQSFPLQSQSDRIHALLAIKKIFKSLPQEDLDKRCAEIENALRCHLGEDQNTMPAIYRPLSAGQISEMASSGFVDFGGHTHSHRILGRCDEATIREEIQICQSKIADLSGQACDLFCYPNGQDGDFNDLTRRLLQKNGFRCALTTIPGRNKAECDPFTLRRFGVSDRESVDWTLLEISGILAKFRNLRGKPDENYPS